MRSWQASQEHSWDTAAKGSSARSAAYRRALQREICVATSQASATVFWDLKAFFDTTQPGKLINLALDAGYPARFLMLSVMMRTAPRSVISDGVVHPEQVVPERGVIAGYLDSVALAKALLLKLVVATRLEFRLLRRRPT